MVPNDIRNVVAGVAACAALCGCASSRLEPLPSEDARAKLATAGIVITTTADSMTVGTPLRGGDAVWEGAKQGLIGACAICADPRGLILAVLVAPPALVIGAATGAANSHSEEEIETAVAAFKAFEEGLQPGKKLQEHLAAAAAKIGTRPQLSFVEMANSAPNDVAVTAEPARSDARFENILTIESGYRICADGKISPDINVIFTEEASLGSDGSGGSLFHRRWELVTHSINYFDAMADNAKLLRAELDTAYAKLAERMVNDLYVPGAINKNSNSGQDLVHAVGEKKTFETCD